MVRVEFGRSDYSRTLKSQAAAASMAKFLYAPDSNRERHLRNFCSIIRVSYCWTILNYRAKLDKHFNLLRQRKVKDARDEEYFNLVINLFGTCKSDEDIHNMRGLVTEYLIWQLCQINRIKGWSMRMGCTVTIDGHLVKVTDGDNSKKTVDVGAWFYSKSYGVFIESKVHPMSFHMIDAAYLEALRAELKKYKEITYRICLFSLDADGLMECRAAQEGYVINDDTLIICEDDIIDENKMFSIDVCGLLK